MRTDPIADLITRIRNVSSTERNETSAPYSKMKEEILKILATEKYILGFNVVSPENAPQKKELVIQLDPFKKHQYTLKRVSKPGQRIYLKAKNNRLIHNGLGIAVVSTSKGLMSNKEAYKQNIGGEVLFTIW